MPRRLNRTDRELGESRRRAMLMMRLTVELMVEQRDECYWCGVPMWHPRRQIAVPFEEMDEDNRATFDHKICLSAGGPDTKENGVASCANCNHHRGNTPFEEYEKWPES